MKKLLLTGLTLILIIVAIAMYTLSDAGNLIKVQIEKHGSAFLDTSVSVASVDLSLSEGRLTIHDTQIKNPKGFSEDNAFFLGEITLDLGTISSEPYTVHNINIDAPEVLYEVDASGKGNLLVLKDNLTTKLPASEEEAVPTPESNGEPGPLVIVEKMTVSNVKLRLNFDALNTGDLDIKQTSYDVTLPTFTANSIGKPNGLPAEQIGAEIAKIMLDNIVTQAKAEAKNKLEDAAKQKLKDAVEEKTNELKEKAKEKLGNLFN